MLAVRCSEYTPPLPAVGVPESMPVAASKVTPEGRASDGSSPSVGAGKPVAVTVWVPAVPTVKVVLAGLVIAGTWSTWRVKAWVASGLTPLLAVKWRV